MIQYQRKTRTCSERARREICFQTKRFEREMRRKWRRWMKLAQKNRLRAAEH